MTKRLNVYFSLRVDVDVPNGMTEDEVIDAIDVGDVDVKIMDERIQDYDTDVYFEEAVETGEE